METEKQRLLVSCIASNRDLLALCTGIIKPSYFDPSLKKTVRFIQEYFSKYKDIPKLATIRAEGGVVLEDVGKIERADIAYVAHEIEEFCQNRAVTEAIIAGPELLDKGDFGKILQSLKEAISVGLAQDIGMNYFEDPEARLLKTLDPSNKYSTGYPDLDTKIGGGVARQELLLLLANSGGGKSMTMLNVAKNLLAQGLNGIYISLEMGEDVVSRRLDSMISRIGQDNLLREINKVAILVEKAAGSMGKFFIKRLPENRTNINTIRSYLQQLEQSTGFKPDFIVIDYIDIMGSTQTVSLDNVFTKDKFVTEEVRSLGYDFNSIMISAAQLNRGSVDAEKLSHAHISGGISKIFTADYVVAVKQDDLMKAAGEIWFEILKSRNSAGVGSRVLLGWDPVSLNILSIQKKGEHLQLKKKNPIILGIEGMGLNKSKSDGVLGLMNT